MTDIKWTDRNGRTWTGEPSILGVTLNRAFERIFDYALAERKARQAEKECRNSEYKLRQKCHDRIEALESFVEGFQDAMCESSTDGKPVPDCDCPSCVARMLMRSNDD